MPRAKDTQRENVYRFEGKQFLDNNPIKLTKREAVELMHQICLDWGVPPTHIQNLRKDVVRTLGKYVRRRKTHPVIKLRQRCYYKHVLIHEVAHHVVHCRFNGVAAHGPEFLRIYAEMLAQYLQPENWIAPMRSSGLSVAVTDSPVYKPAPSELNLFLGRNTLWVISHTYQQAFWDYHRKHQVFPDDAVVIMESHYRKPQS